MVLLANEILQWKCQTLSKNADISHFQNKLVWNLVQFRSLFSDFSVQKKDFMGQGERYAFLIV